ncbi:MAG: ribonuclease E activity regulator RraA, partial [Gammaproteobacteria bacterium]
MEPERSEQKFSTPDLCDAHPSVHVLAPIFSDYGSCLWFFGEVVTVKCFEDNSLVKEQLSQAGRGRVLVVDGGGSHRCAMLGDRLAQMAADHNWSGILLNGCVRDVEVMASINVGVKALGVHPRKSLKRGTGEVNVPIYIAEAHVMPGQFIYSDPNGVIIS